MIVEYTSEALPEFDGIIMIDCWQPVDHQIDKQIFFYRLSDYISKHVSNYRQIINASRECRFDYDDRSIINTLQQYCWQYEVDKSNYKIPNYYNNPILINAFKQFRNSLSLFSGIKKQLHNLDTCYYIVTIEDFLSHWHTQGPMRAQHWLVVGQSWQICVHNNNVGLNQMAQAAKFHHMNFYVTEEYLLNDTDQNPTEIDFSNDTLQWIKYHGTSTYQLAPIK
jgi:hypothetical protein